METITFKKFLSAADDYLCNAAIDKEPYTVSTPSGKVVVIKESEWQKLVALQSKKD